MSIQIRQAKLINSLYDDSNSNFVAREVVLGPLRCALEMLPLFPTFADVTMPFEWDLVTFGTRRDEGRGGPGLIGRPPMGMENVMIVFSGCVPLVLVRMWQQTALQSLHRCTYPSAEGSCDQGALRPLSVTSNMNSVFGHRISKNAVFSSITNIFFMCHATGKLVATIGSSFVAWRMAKYFPVLTLRMVWPAPSGATSHFWLSESFGGIPTSRLSSPIKSIAVPLWWLIKMYIPRRI